MTLPPTSTAKTADDLVPYTVMIKATDPSGAVGQGNVTVNLKDVNESPAFVPLTCTRIRTPCT